MKAIANAVIVAGAAGLFAAPAAPSHFTSNQSVAIQIAPLMSGQPHYQIQVKPAQTGSGIITVLPGRCAPAQSNSSFQPGTPKLTNIPESWVVDTLKVGKGGVTVLEGHNANGIKSWTPWVVPIARPEVTLTGPGAITRSRTHP